MDLVKHLQDHNPRLSLSSDSKFQRRTIQTGALVSTLSGMLLFLFSLLLVPLCSHSFKIFSFSACLMELQPLSYTLTKNFMFLLCIGILVILFWSSGLIETGRSGIGPSGPQTAHYNPQFDGHGCDFSNEATEERGTTDAEEKRRGEFLIQKDEIQDQGSELAITEATHDDGDGNGDSDEGHDNGDAYVKLTMEEFNSKCDDYIKKMKGEA